VSRSQRPSGFEIAIPDEDLADLSRRLDQVRWPSDIANDDWRYGTELGYLRDFVRDWRETFDWRKVEREMNRLEHFLVRVDGVPIHYVHERGKGPAPVPLILTHGWPWTFWDMRKLIGPLTDPGAHGGDPADSFDVVVPSLPGFAFSGPLTTPGIGAGATAALWARLMRDVLGYDRFGAQGNDFGAIVTQHLAQTRSDLLIGVHLSRYRRPAGTGLVNTGVVTAEDYGPGEDGAWERHQAGLPLGASHLAVHTHDPQTLAYALNDSPVGLAAWLLERRRNWSGCNGDLETVFDREELITNVMLYWLTGSFGSSARFYWESARETPAPVGTGRVIEAPLAVGVLPQDVIAMPRAHAEQDTNLARWTQFEQGGHFGPAEVPKLYVHDLREFFRPLR
jgi:pimeloyl-ACP methyl ester carboxylesterase